MDNSIWPTARNQEDIVKQTVGAGVWQDRTDEPEPVGLLPLLEGLPETERDLGQVIFNTLRSYSHPQEIAIVFGEYKDTSIEQGNFPDVTSREKKTIAEAMARQVASDDRIVAVYLSVEGRIAVERLKAGGRMDKDNVENFGPKFKVKYRARR